MNVKKISLPKESLAASYFKKHHYADAYQASFKNPNKVTASHAVKTFFTATPAWVLWLMQIRNSVVKLFGLKTTEIKDIKEIINNFQGKVGESFAGSFKVLAVKEGEILTGETDKHLDFCLSFIIQERGHNYQISLVTVVHFNGCLGRFYFLPVKPMHKLIVRAILKRMVKEIQSLTQ